MALCKPHDKLNLDSSYELHDAFMNAVATVVSLIGFLDEAVPVMMWALLS